MTSTFFTAGNTRANEEKTFSLELFGASDRIRIVGVAAINDNIALFKVRNQLSDEIIDGRPGLHKKNDLAGTLKFGGEFLDRVGTLDLRALSEEI